MIDPMAMQQIMANAQRFQQFQQQFGQFMTAIAACHLAKEIVGLRWNHTQEIDVFQQAKEAISLGNKLGASIAINALILVEYLHVKLGH